MGFNQDAQTNSTICIIIVNCLVKTADLKLFSKTAVLHFM